MTTGTQSAAEELRVLPSRIRPLPGEALDSWIEASAAAHRATMREMLDALGLGRTESSKVTSWTMRQWTIRLGSEQAAAIEETTRIPAARIQQMTLSDVAPHAVVYVNDKISPICEAVGGPGQFCPQCLADTDGRWLLSWQLRFTVACPIHRRLLEHFCPVCGKDPRRRGHPLAQIPEPGRCHNAGDDDGPFNPRCRADLAVSGDRLPASEGVLAAQEAMSALAVAGEASFGIYQGLPQPASAVFKDIRLLSRLAQDALASGDDIDDTSVGTELVAQFRAGVRKFGYHVEGPSFLRHPVGLSLAYDALSRPERAAALMRGRIPASTVYTECSSQLRELISSERGSLPRPTAILRSAPRSPSPPESRAQKVPALLWQSHATRANLPGIDQEVVATALAASVVLTGTSLTHTQALELIGLPPSRHVSYVLQEISRSPRPGRALRLVLELARYLDTHDAPIDYARRRALDCSNLLPADMWRHICESLNLKPGGGKSAALARAWLTRTVMGNPIRYLVLDDPKRTVTAKRVDAFAAALPLKLELELRRVAEAFLTSAGILEPVTWEPEVAQLPSATSSAPVRVLTRRWRPAKPAQDRLDADEIARRHASGDTTYALALEMGVSRQTVVRVLEEAGGRTRPGRRKIHEIDADWLRHRYLTDRYSARQIAAEVGCAPATIQRLLHEAGIPTRRGGSQTRASAPTGSERSRQLPISAHRELETG
jgi:hypothetical protein